jgi:hypothetical protein
MIGDPLAERSRGSEDVGTADVIYAEPPSVAPHAASSMSTAGRRQLPSVSCRNSSGDSSSNVIRCPTTSPTMLTCAGLPLYKRVRHDRVDKTGVVTLRYLSRLHHIGLGADYRGLPVHLLVANKNVRVIREDGSLIRELVLDPTRDYQPLGTKSGPKPRVVNDVVRHVSTMS